MNQMKLLLVEDSPEMTLLVSTALKERYLVTCASTSIEALNAIKNHEFSLLILDIELPDEDGFVLLSKIRMNPKYQETPVFFLSGRSRTSDKVMGFTLGAEDYLVKPVDPIELQIRVDSRIQRLKREVQKDRVLQKGPFVADLERQLLKILSDKGEEFVDLTPIEFKLFVYFLRKEDRIMSRDQILNEIWPNTEVTDRTVDSHIYTLRKKLGSWGASIEAVPKVGYRFLDLSKRKAA